MKRAAVALAATLVFCWLAQEVLLNHTRVFDTDARVFAQRIASTAVTLAMRGFTLLGEPATLLVLAALAAVLFLRKGRRRPTWLLAVTMAGGELLDQALKILFHRARPEPFFGLETPHSYSFPSGHALMSCCFFGMMAALLTVREPRRAVRVTLWVIASLLAAAIGFSRIYLGVHYASDVLAGYLAAVAWVFTVATIYGLPYFSVSMK